MRRSRLRTGLLGLLVVLPAITVAACGTLDTAPPSTPTPARVTEMFEGTLTQLGSASYPFVVSATGSTEITVTSMAPLATFAIGVSVGSWNSVSCVNANIRNDGARTGSVALKGTTQPGNYCIRVYDSGNFFADTAATYTIQVVHP